MARTSSWTAAGPRGEPRAEPVNSFSPLAYRADIDGLRAIAVLAVFLFHADAGLGGGYIGVDVFFVISGYLIGQILVREGRLGMGGLWRFWWRRLRRIAPALIVVCAAVFAAGTYLMMPTELKAYGTSERAALGYFSNFLFAGQADYFDAPSLSKPLLHTWSLSLEAQFYLLVPLVFYITGAWPRLRLAILVACLLASLAASVYAVRHQPVQAFYMPCTRVWEFLVGCVLALQPTRAASRALVWGLEIAGALVLGLCMAAYSADSRFPGELALAPVLASAALLWAGGTAAGGPVSRWLASRGLVAFGRVSYAFYLWHWPLIVLWTYAVAEKPQGAGVAVLLVASLGLAAATRRWVEQPFLRWRGWPAAVRFRLAAGALAVAGVTAWAGVQADRAEGWPGRLSPEATAYAAGAKDVAPDAEHCHTLKPERILQRQLCPLGEAAAGKPRLVVWGDSHAHALYGAFDKLTRDQGLQGLHASYSACPPLLGVEVATHINDECRRFNAAMIDFIAQARIPVVVLVAYWSIYPMGYLPHGMDMGKQPFLVRDVGQTGTQADSQALFSSALKETIQKLSTTGAKIYVLKQFPEATASIPLGLARAELFPWKPSHYLQPRRGEVEERQAFVTAQFQAVSRRYPVEFIDTHDFLCEGGYCQIESAGRSLYRDSNHLSGLGAMHIAPLLVPVLRDAAGDPMNAK